MHAVLRSSAALPVLVLAALGAGAGCADTASTSGADAVATDEASPPTSGKSGRAPASSTEPAPGPTAPAPTMPTPAPSGSVTFKLLTYNVAGLPQGISKSNPLPNTPQMSPKLNPFDLVVVQEDFAYHDALVSAATHPFKSTPMPSGSNSLGDGLNTLSRLPFSDFTRTKWEKCNGFVDQSNDCLTPKGFTRFVLDLGSGRTVDVYDVHFDAGGGAADIATRDLQVDQLTAAIAQSSPGRAVIVAGDTNMRASSEAVFQKLLANASLSDACRTLQCAEPERIDRVMYRSGGGVTLTAKSWAVDMTFVDANGEQLSDHEPVAVTIEAK